MAPRNPDDLIIEPGRTLGDLKTLKDFEEARVICVSEIISMEKHLGAPPANTADDWEARTKAALKWRKLTLDYVIERRRLLLRETKAEAELRRLRRIMDKLAMEAPDAYHRAMEEENG